MMDQKCINMEIVEKKMLGHNFSWYCSSWTKEKMLTF